MITRQELCAFLDDLLQPNLFSDFAVNGLQVEGKENIQTIATAVSASEATLHAAADAGVDALIVHHGLFWNKDPLPVVGPLKRKLELLLKQGISLFAYHLPLDAHRDVGNNWKAARDLGWTELEPFGVFNGVPIGVKGAFASISRVEFKNRLEEYYQHPAHTALGGTERVATAALISGGAYKSLPEAAKAGVDAFITGSFDEPAWHQAHELNVNFFALGHSHTEKVGPQALGVLLHQCLSLPCRFIDVPNPF